MDKEHTAGVVIFVVVFMALQTAYFKVCKNRFTIDDKQFVQVGVVAQEHDGDTLYIPVFRRIQK